MFKSDESAAVEWEGTCGRCDSVFVWTKIQCEQPCVDAEGKSYGCFCPVCKETKHPVVGVIHFKPRQSKPLTFGELEIGESFIAFPTDGDDSGHGGFRRGSFVFIKTSDENATRYVDRNLSHMPDTMKVLKILV